MEVVSGAEAMVNIDVKKELEKLENHHLRPMAVPYIFGGTL